MRVARFVFLATSGALPLLAPHAYAEGGAVEDAIARGIALRREHKDADALVEFRQAYSLSRAPRALAQVALAEAALERWVPAESDLLRALAADDDEWIEHHRPELRLALKELQEHLSTLEVVCGQPAQLWIDGVFVTQLPVSPLRVVAKHLVLELHLTGFALARREVDAPAGGVVHEEVALERADPLAAVSAGARAGAPPPLVPASTAPVREARTQRTLAWVSAGAAGVFVAGAVAATVWGADRASAFNNDHTCWDGKEPQGGNCAMYRSQVGSAQIAVDIAYPAAGLAAVASAVLFLALPRPTTSVTHARAWCLPTAGGIACGGMY